MSTLKNSTFAKLGALAIVAGLTLTGCAAGTNDDTDAAASDSEAADWLSITDPWVKSAETGMSAAFGEIVNDGDEDIVVEAASTEASSMLELHETVENETGAMVMREIDGGFVIPAGESLTLAPGGNHIMLMDLTNPLVAGDDVEFTLTLEDGSEFTFTAVVKDYSGANENYEGGDMDMDMDDEMDMGGE